MCRKVWQGNRSCYERTAANAFSKFKGAALLQVIVVDHDSDEELVRVDAKAAEAIDLYCDQGPIACIQVSCPSPCA